MISAGIDIGSRTVKVAVAESGRIIHTKKMINSYNPVETCREILAGVKYDSLTATGYGRHLAAEYLGCGVVSEIKAFAAGAGAFAGGCRTILDIGGQDTKAISIGENGNVLKFEMNDKCAAGTGRFLEVMAAALGFMLDEFADSALSAVKGEQINSTCTVFAESEVVSLVTKGVPREEIALGIHKSMTSRAVSLLKRVSIKEEVVFAGGVAMNSCMKSLIEKELGCALLIPEDPQIVGAAGCALIGLEN